MSFLRFSKILPIYWTAILFLTLVISIHVKSTKSTVTTSTVIFSSISLLFLSLSEKVVLWSLTNLKSIKLIFILLLLFWTWKSIKTIFVNRFILKVSKVRKINWFFAPLFLSKLIWSIYCVSLISELREMNWLLVLVWKRFLLWDSFAIENYLLIWTSWNMMFSGRKWWCIYRVSLRGTRNILKLIKIKTLVILLLFNWKFPTIIQSLGRSICFNFRFILCHCLKRIFNTDIFRSILS